MKILVVNPGSTSTKIGYFENETQIFDKVLRHTSEELSAFDSITHQYNFRMAIIEEFMFEQNIDVSGLDAIVGMGGLISPVRGGTYLVNDKMTADLKDGIQGEHASNLGGLIAKAIGDKINSPAFIVDPVVVDEFHDLARISGHPLIPRR